METFTVIDKSAQLWLFKTAHKNYWRVQSWYDLDDLIQDGYMTWCMVADRYADSVRERCKDQPENQRHDAMVEVMMSLFRRSYTNHIHDLASRRSRTLEVAVSDLDPVEQSHAQVFENTTPAYNAAREAEVVDLAPDGIREVLQLYNNDPASPKISARFRVRRDGSRETLNERFCRLSGCDPDKCNLVNSVYQYLTDDNFVVAG